MPGLAIFGLKYPSLLQFDKNRNEERIKANLQTLYRVEQAPSDTYLRERLDEVDPNNDLRKTFSQTKSRISHTKDQCETVSQSQRTSGKPGDDHQNCGQKTPT
ncbi:MAG TPA: hypothetical protein ENK06_00940 [Gammaproteobacteria bacterium]|nr:hypothetical protein [Gammaproteobacteria bacterium]